MSNRSSSKQHGCHRIKRLQPTKKTRLKAQKATARVRQQQRQDTLQQALATVPA